MKRSPGSSRHTQPATLDVGKHLFGDILDRCRAVTPDMLRVQLKVDAGTGLKLVQKRMSDEPVHDVLPLHVRKLLLTVWDSIGVLKLGGLETEYDEYVREVTALVRDGTLHESAIVEHLKCIEETMALAASPSVEKAARALLGLRNACHREAEVLVEQILSPNGLFAIWLFARDDGGHFYEMAKFFQSNIVGQPSTWQKKAWSGIFHDPVIARDCAQEKADYLWGGQSKLLTDFKYRIEIIEYLEIAFSYEEQLRYERDVPIANIPHEMIEQWTDLVDEFQFDNYGEPAYSLAENAAIRRYHAVWEDVIERLPFGLLPLAELIGSETWERLRLGAEEALAIFRIRGNIQ